MSIAISDGYMVIGNTAHVSRKIQEGISRQPLALKRASNRGLAHCRVVKRSEMMGLRGSLQRVMLLRIFCHVLAIFDPWCLSTNIH